MKKPPLHKAFGILAIPKAPESEPQADSEQDDDHEEELHEACKELAEILGVPDNKYEDFSDALGAYVEAKFGALEAEPHKEGGEEGR
jgi:hypothetical protein